MLFEIFYNWYAYKILCYLKIPLASASGKGGVDNHGGGVEDKEEKSSLVDESFVVINPPHQTSNNKKGLIHF